MVRKVTKDTKLKTVPPNLSLRGHGTAGTAGLKVGPGPEYDVEVLRAAAGDAVTLPHPARAALAPPLVGALGGAGGGAAVGVSLVHLQPSQPQPGRADMA